MKNLHVNQMDDPDVQAQTKDIMRAQISVFKKLLEFHLFLLDRFLKR